MSLEYEATYKLGTVRNFYSIANTKFRCKKDVFLIYISDREV